jgi:L-fuconolactonase
MTQLSPATDRAAPGRHVVDSHAHIISSDPARFPYAPFSGALPDWLPERAVDAELLLERMALAGVDQAVLVQYSSVHGYDNGYVLDVAQRYPSRFAAVCTLDGRAPGAPDQLTTLVRDHGAAGLRIRAPARSGPFDWLECEPLWRRAVDLDLPMCVHLMPHDSATGLPVLVEILSRFQDATVVLDHVANPPWRPDPPDFGLDSVLPLARFERVIIKFATLNLERLEAAHVEPGPVLRRLVEVFGADRVMWGSDAPNTPGEYAEMLLRMRTAISDLSIVDQGAVLARTAQSVYPRLAGTERSTPDADLSVAERSR